MGGNHSFDIHTNYISCWMSPTHPAERRLFCFQLIEIDNRDHSFWFPSAIHQHTTTYTTTTTTTSLIACSFPIIKRYYIHVYRFPYIHVYLYKFSREGKAKNCDSQTRIWWWKKFFASNLVSKFCVAVCVWQSNVDKRINYRRDDTHTHLRTHPRTHLLTTNKRRGKTDSNWNRKTRNWLTDLDPKRIEFTIGPSFSSHHGRVAITDVQRILPKRPHRPSV